MYCSIRGKERPNSLSCDSSTATLSNLATMIDRTVHKCGENSEMKYTLKKHAIICSKVSMN